MIDDEANFCLNGKVKPYLVRHYAPKDGSHASFNFNQNSSRLKLNVWAGICGNKLLLQSFFF